MIQIVAVESRQRVAGRFNQPRNQVGRQGFGGFTSAGGICVAQVMPDSF